MTVPDPAATTGAAATETAYLGIGANLGDAQAAVRTAIAECARLPLTRLLAASSLYRSAPIDSTGNDYINAVVRLATALAPAELLCAMQAVERRHGRERPWRNAPRTLDLDLLLFGTLRMQAPALTLPHPRMHERAFVLLPLAEIAPALEVPGQGRLTELLEGVADQRIERLVE